MLKENIVKENNMRNAEIMERMLEIQEKYNNNSILFHKDNEYIELASDLKNDKPKRISLQKVIID